MTHDEFTRLVAPHRNALRLHCYRMLASTHDGDDVLQETLVRAWRARTSLESVQIVRAWLYRIATNACLDELEHRKQRVMPSHAVAAATDPDAAPLPVSPEIMWLEPCPDGWTAGVVRDPDSAYEVKESVALAFIAALQCLSPQQRAVHLLRDVLGMPADETATTLDMSVSATKSTLHRARAAVRARAGATGDAAAIAIAIAIDATSEIDEELLRKYLQAWEALDLPALVALLHDEVIASMPPSPTWISGKAATARFLATRVPIFAASGHRIVLTSANGQPALAFYVKGRLHGLQVVRLEAGRVAELHYFRDPHSLEAFGLEEET